MLLQDTEEKELKKILWWCLGSLLSCKQLVKKKKFSESGNWHLNPLTSRTGRLDLEQGQHGFESPREVRIHLEREIRALPSGHHNTLLFQGD